MIVTIVSIHVKPERVDDFIAATVKNHEGSVAEPGNLRFDVLQQKDNPARFTLYEAYESQDAARAHKETAHYLAWRDAVAGMMLTPRVGVAHDVVKPDAGGWR